MLPSTNLYPPYAIDSIERKQRIKRILRDNDIQIASERAVRGFGCSFLKATTSAYTLTSPSRTAMKFLSYSVSVKLFFTLDQVVNFASASSCVESPRDRDRC